MQIRFPFQLGSRGAVRETGEHAHIREMIEQLLFTIPGERVNRPDFGCGLSTLLFANASTELAVATQALVQSALQRWLGDLIQVRLVHVQADAGTLRVDVEYIVLADRTLRREFYHWARL